MRSVRVMYGIPVPPAPLTAEQLNFVDVATPPATASKVTSQQQQTSVASPPLVAVGRVISTQLPTGAHASSGDNSGVQAQQAVVAPISVKHPSAASEETPAVPPPLPAPAKRPSVTPYVPVRTVEAAPSVKSPVVESPGGWGAARAGSGDSSFINSFFGRSASSSSNTAAKGPAQSKGSATVPSLQQPSKAASTPGKKSSSTTPGGGGGGSSRNGDDYDDFFAEL